MCRSRTSLLFAPIMVNFVMNFRDINRWFLRFPKPANEFEKIINGNTQEDETHSRLFLEDWEKLKLDKNWAGDPRTRSGGCSWRTTQSRFGASA